MPLHTRWYRLLGGLFWLVLASMYIFYMYMIKVGDHQTSNSVILSSSTIPSTSPRANWGDSYASSSFLLSYEPEEEGEDGYCEVLQSRYMSAFMKDRASLGSFHSNRKKNSQSTPSAHSHNPPMLSEMHDFQVASKVERIESLIMRYKQEHRESNLFAYDKEIMRSKEGQLGINHSADLLTEEQILHRKERDEALCRSNQAFVLGVFSCPRQIGNRLHEFLNAFAAAIATNRTLIWKFCDRRGCFNSPKECQQFLSLAPVSVGPHSSTTLRVKENPWVASAATIVQRLRNGGCDFPTYELSNSNDGTKGGFEGPWRYPESYSAGSTQDAQDDASFFSNGVVPDQVVPHSQYSSSGEAVIACCGIDTLSTHRIIDVGSLERRELFGLSLAGANLGPKAFTRVSTLFSAGEAYAYGSLFRHSFRFTNTTIRWNAELEKFYRVQAGNASGRESAEHRRLSRDPFPDDDEPPATTDKKLKMQKHVDQQKTPGRSGKQIIPVEALALPSTGSTTVRSAGGTSVGPLAGASKNVHIADSGGKEGTDAAILSGAAPKVEQKANHSPEVPLSRTHKKEKDIAAAHTGPSDRWSAQHAGNFTSKSEQSSQKYYSPGGMNNGIADKLMQTSSFHAEVQAAAQKGQVANVLRKSPQSKPRAPLKEIPPVQEMHQLHDLLKNGDLPNAPADFVLAVHLRHMNKADLGDVDRTGELACIKEMLGSQVPNFKKYQEEMSNLIRRHDKDQKRVGGPKVTRDHLLTSFRDALPNLSCLVLLASDRKNTLVRLVRDVRALGCNVQIAPRKNALPFGDISDKFNEHGPYRDGILPIADLELLSHADAFIGSSDGVPKEGEVSLLSTYSMLVESLVVTNTRNLRRISENPSQNILTHPEKFIRWLPKCSSGFSSYRISETPVTEPHTKKGYQRNNKTIEVKIGGGNGRYDSTDCEFFTWGRRCGDGDLLRKNKVCAKY